MNEDTAHSPIKQSYEVRKLRQENAGLKERLVAAKASQEDDDVFSELPQVDPNVDLSPTQLQASQDRPYDPEIRDFATQSGSQSINNDRSPDHNLIKTAVGILTATQEDLPRDRQRHDRIEQFRRRYM
jgi:hypothetical protein